MLTKPPCFQFSSCFYCGAGLRGKTRVLRVVVMETGPGRGVCARAGFTCDGVGVGRVLLHFHDAAVERGLQLLQLGRRRSHPEQSLRAQHKTGRGEDVTSPGLRPGRAGWRSACGDRRRRRAASRRAASRRARGRSKRLTSSCMPHSSSMVTQASMGKAISLPLMFRWSSRALP